MELGRSRLDGSRKIAGQLLLLIFGLACESTGFAEPQIKYDGLEYLQLTLGSRIESFDIDLPANRSAIVSSKLGKVISPEVGFRWNEIPFFLKYELHQIEYEGVKQFVVQTDSSFRHGFSGGLNMKFGSTSLRLGAGYGQEYFFSSSSAKSVSFERIWIPKLGAHFELPFSLMDDPIYKLRVSLGLQGTAMALLPGKSGALIVRPGESFGGGVFFRINSLQINGNYTRQRQSTSVANQYLKYLQLDLSWKIEF